MEIEKKRYSKCMLRECTEWEVSMTWPSQKISTGKSIWEWVRLTLTPSVQPMMSWEESSWQRIRILETHIDRGSEIHSSAHLKTHTHTRRKPTCPSIHTNLVNARGGWWCHIHIQYSTVLQFYQTCTRVLTQTGFHGAARLEKYTVWFGSRELSILQRLSGKHKLKQLWQWRNMGSTVL